MILTLTYLTYWLILTYRILKLIAVLLIIMKREDSYFMGSLKEGDWRNIFVEIFNDSDSMQILTSQHQTIIEMDQLAGIHRVTLFKQPGSNYLLARVVLMDDLFHYQYPFRFPDLFEGNLTKYERSVYNAAEIIGYKDIKSTLAYKRYALNKREIHNLLNKIDKDN